MRALTPIDTCLYCQKNDLFNSLMIKICELEVSEVFLFKEQSYKGRCIVSYKNHAVDLHDLSDEQRNAFMSDVAKTANAIEAAFKPTKMNYGSFGDGLTHLHMHVVPKYKDGYTFGSMFEMNPQKVYLSENEYSEIINKIRAEL
jgi:diadenosine tetraphosphate (Ap4A) HIT family hydrolase